MQNKEGLPVYDDIDHSIPQNIYLEQVVAGGLGAVLFVVLLLLL